MGFTIIHGGAGTFEQQQATMQGFNILGNAATSIKAGRDREKQMALQEEHYQAELARAAEQMQYNRDRQAVADERSQTVFDQSQGDRARFEADRIATEEADARAEDLIGRSRDLRTGEPQSRLIDEPNAGLAVFKTAIAGTFGRDAAEMFPDPELSEDTEEFLDQAKLELLDSKELSPESAQRLAQEFSIMHKVHAATKDLKHLQNRLQRFAQSIEGFDPAPMQEELKHLEKTIQDVQNGEADPSILAGIPSGLSQEIDAQRDQVMMDSATAAVGAQLAALSKGESTLPEDVLKSLYTAYEKANTLADMKKLGAILGMTPEAISALGGVKKLLGGDPPPVGGGDGGAVASEDEQAALQELGALLDEPGTSEADYNEAVNQFVQAFGRRPSAAELGGTFAPPPPADPTPVGDALMDVAGDVVGDVPAKIKKGWEVLKETNPALGAVADATEDALGLPYKTAKLSYAAAKRSAKGVMMLSRLWNMTEDDAKKLAFGIRGVAEEWGISDGVISKGTTGARAARRILNKGYQDLLDGGMAPVDNWENLTKMQQFQYINAIKNAQAGGA